MERLVLGKIRLSTGDPGPLSGDRCTKMNSHFDALKFGNRPLDRSRGYSLWSGMLKSIFGQKWPTSKLLSVDQTGAEFVIFDKMMERVIYVSCVKIAWLRYFHAGVRDGSTARFFLGKVKSILVEFGQKFLVLAWNPVGEDDGQNRQMPILINPRHLLYFRVDFVQSLRFWTKSV